MDDRVDVAAPGDERVAPSVHLPPEDPTGGLPRTTRDSLVDLATVVGAAALGGASLYLTVDSSPEPLAEATVVVDIVAGTVAVLLLLLRRRYPVAVGAATVTMGAVSILAGFAATVALFNVAVHRRFTKVLPIAAANLIVPNVFWLLRPAETSLLTANALGVASVAIVVGFGMYVRARRQLVWTLEERARRAEADQQVLAEQARAAERARIAREMHDVLGHRISLMTLHAGGLTLRPDLPPEEIAATAELLRSTARQALDDLRAIIGILRDDGSVDATASPQPTLADIHRLVDESRQAGATVGLSLDLEDGAVAPPGAGRVAYRVVQEALTNVAKHAPGAATIVNVTGGPDRGLLVGVRNVVEPHPTGWHPAGGGVGLVGLRERVELAGGTLTHGMDHRGEFVVEARLRWA